MRGGSADSHREGRLLMPLQRGWKASRSFAVRGMAGKSTSISDRSTEARSRRRQFHESRPGKSEAFDSGDRCHCLDLSQTWANEYSRRTLNVEPAT